MRTRNPTETRDKLLAAATRVIAAHGATHTTLELVAREAGTSKGGLLHHFPTKQALLQGLMDEIGQVFKRRLERALEAEPEGTPGRWSRAYVHASFEYDDGELQLTNAIASVVMGNPELVETLKADLCWIDEQLERDGLPAARATTIRLACDGLWLAELLDLSTVQEPLRSSLRADLLELTRCAP